VVYYGLYRVLIGFWWSFGVEFGRYLEIGGIFRGILGYMARYWLDIG